MNPGLRALDLFEEVVAMPEAGRAVHLAQQCEGDPQLRAEVEELLRNDDKTLRVQLDLPCLGLDFHAADPGLVGKQRLRATPQSLGRYRLLAEIGSGGMGVVYRAEQDLPRREVALKLLNHDAMASHGFSAFEREAQALAQLRHPGIAHVYDAGVLLRDDGLEVPFLAMELVEGPRLLQWIVDGNPDRRARLRLLVDVCEAVDAAHRSGVIHRDLKPDNILVESHGSGPRPRIVDFGIAQLLDDGPEPVGAIVGTLPYMSPEQAAGAVVDARSDVYSIGAIAYQLLTGAPPIDVGKTPYREALRRIREEECPPLSRHCRELWGDLEHVVAKALAKAPAERYQSPRALANDLLAVLAKRPVRARRHTIGYLLACHVRRNRGMCVALGVGLATAGLGIGVWSPARGQSLGVVGTASFAVQNVVGKLATMAGTAAVRRETLLHLLPEIEAYRRQNPLDSRATACHYELLRRLGDIAVDEAEWDVALSLRTQALAVLAELHRLEPTDTAGWAEWATAQVRLADVEKRTASLTVARERYEGAHEEYAGLVAANPDDPRLLDDLGWSCDRMGQLVLDLGDPVRAEEFAAERERVLERLRLLRPTHPSTLAGERALNCLRSNIAGALGRIAERCAFTLASIEAARRWYETYPNASQPAIEWASSASTYLMLVRGTPDEERGLAMAREAGAALERILQQEPKHAVARDVYVGLQNLLGSR